MKYPQTIRSILIPLFAAGITAGSTIACAATDIVEPGPCQAIRQGLL